MARPKKAINATQVYKLAQIGCTDEEIGDILGLHAVNIAKRFVAELTKGRANLRERLRRKQIQVALNGNVVMLIWLGKQILDQREKQEIFGAPNHPIQVQAVDYRLAVAALAPGSVVHLPAPGENQGAFDGAPLGENGHGRRPGPGDGEPGRASGLDSADISERSATMAHGGTSDENAERTTQGDSE